MSQARVTEYFSTRKRNRFNQDDVLLNKQKKTQTLLDPSEMKCELIKHELERTTRSKTKIQAKEELTEKKAEKAPSTPKKKPENEENNEPKPQKKAPSGASTKRKQQLEEIKSRASRLDDKLAKIRGGSKNDESVRAAPEPSLPPIEVSQPTPVQQETPVVPAPKKPAASRKKVNMAELKEKIQLFNQNLIAMQESSEKTKEKCVEENAKSSKQKTILTSKNSNQVEVQPDSSHSLDKYPAYLLHKDLASAEIDNTCTLTLPTSYALLLDSFRASDTIMKLLHNRQEVCTFLKLKKGIQNITKHNYMLKNLAQTKTVYPQAYIYKQEKMFIDFKNDFHLTISPNLEEIELNPATNLRDFTPNVLLKRLNKFKSNLFQIVKDLHQKFLKSIKITNLDSNDIKRWHPKFDLQNIDEIEEAELPQPPNEIKCKSGQELLSIAKDVYSSRIQSAIKESVTIETKIETTKTVTITTMKTTDSITIVNCASSLEKNLTAEEKTALMLKEKKIASHNALLEKIRNKEKAKALETMVMNSDTEKNKVKYSTYKEIIRFLLTFFLSEKKGTIEFDKICAKISENFKAKYNEFECRDLFTNLCADELFHGENKQWLKIIKVRNLNYVQMDKTFQLNDLWGKCDTMIQ